MSKKYKQILVRLSTDEEIELFDKFELLIKNKRKRKSLKNGEQKWYSFPKNEILKKILLDHMKNIVLGKEMNQTLDILRETTTEILDSVIIPRIYGMNKTFFINNESNLELISKKLNFLLNELSIRDLADGRPIIEQIEMKIDEKKWMEEVAFKIKEANHIKEKF